MTVAPDDQISLANDARKLLTRITNVRIGEKLPNGAILLAQSDPVVPENTALVSIVLAVHTGYQPFVTWRRVRELTDNGKTKNVGYVDYCVHGHYFRSLAEALHDFDSRR